MEFFSRVKCEGTWQQHNATLKYYREICEHATVEALSFSTERMAAVAAIDHPPGERFWFAHEDKRVWSWWVMVAQIDEDSIRYVVEDGDRSRGLVGCEVRRRRNPYDHKRQVQCPDGHPQLRDWAFILKRSDGTAVRLQPQWSKKDIPTFYICVGGRRENPTPSQRVWAD